MSTTTPISKARTATAEDRRAARLARIRSDRATRAPLVPVDVVASDVVAGDWLDQVRTQAGVRGAIVQRTVKAVEVTHDEWGRYVAGRRRKVPVEGRVFHFDDNGPTITCPAAFRVTVRRAAS